MQVYYLEKDDWMPSVGASDTDDVPRYLTCLRTAGGAFIPHPRELLPVTMTYATLDNVPARCVKGGG